MYYLDHCGSTPIAREVELVMIDFLKSGNYGNPTAVHHEAGRRAHDAIESARDKISKELGAKSNQIIFTSGASEANNLMLWGFALRYRARGCHIFYGATEHKSIFDSAQYLAELDGVSCSELRVLSDGTVDLDYLESELTKHEKKVSLVALMHANNEIPARHPVEKISDVCKKHGAFFHCDGVQGFVREPLNFDLGTYGSYVISTHKIYGPKGLGILVLGDHKLSARINPPFRGGSHEHGLRPGTQNTLAIVAAAEAISLHNERRPERLRHMSACAEAFFSTFKEKITDAKLTLPITQEVAGLINFYVPGVDAPTILENNPDICINRGASCIGSGGETFSHVPKALGLPLEIQANVLRVSFGDAVTVSASVEAAELLAKRIQNIRDPR